MTQRGIASVLCASGILLMLAFGTVLPFLFGWLVWFGWLLIALDVQSLETPLFWAVSIAWSAVFGALIALAFFAHNVTVPIAVTLAVVHTLIAVAGSIWAYVLAVRMRPVRWRGRALMPWIPPTVLVGLFALVPAVLVPILDRTFIDIDTKQDVATVFIENFLVPSVARFHHDVGRYPTTAEGLKALVVAPANTQWHGPYFPSPREPLDPWGRPYRYCAPGRRSGGAYDIWSAGPDGIDSGDDIGNWSR